MKKLSAATGYIYGYVQDLESGMWQYIILDFETGETVFTMDVSNKYGYNNMAIGMYAGNSGNALYCPTGYLELLRLQDRFVYLPKMPYRRVDLDKAARNVLTQEQFEQDGGEGTVASWRSTVAVKNVHPNTTVAIRMNNLSGSSAELKLYACCPMSAISLGCNSVLENVNHLRCTPCQNQTFRHCSIRVGS